MRELRKNSMRKNKISGNTKSTRKTHHYNKGDNRDYRQLQLVMNVARDIDPESRATFEGFRNAIFAVGGIWLFVGICAWLFG